MAQDIFTYFFSKHRIPQINHIKKGEKDKKRLNISPNTLKYSYAYVVDRQISEEESHLGNDTKRYPQTKIPDETHKEIGNSQEFTMSLFLR